MRNLLYQLRLSVEVKLLDYEVDMKGNYEMEGTTRAPHGNISVFFNIQIKVVIFLRKTKYQKASKLRWFCFVSART